MPVGLTVNGQAVGYFPDPRHPELALVQMALRQGDVLVFSYEDGSRRHYRVNDFQRLPMHVHLAPHVTMFRTDPPRPPPPPIEASPIGPSVWERVRKPLLA